MSVLLTSQRRDWTPQDDQIIKTNMDSMTHAEIAKRIGRTKRAIDQRIQKLDLAKKRPNKRFTPEEITQIKKMRATKTNIQQIANSLSRSYQSVAAKIHAMGL